MVKNNLVVIENGQINTYLLDDRNVWEIGRPAKGNTPDIKLYSETVSRRHGKFQNMDGIWFYVDNNGKNGTVYNETHLTTGINGRIKPILISDGDCFVFGGAQEAVINSKTVWAMFMTKAFYENWKVLDTKDKKKFAIEDEKETIYLENPEKGTVIRREKGMAIYMGDITYLAGDMSLAESFVTEGNS